MDRGIIKFKRSFHTEKLFSQMKSNIINNKAKLVNVNLFKYNLNRNHLPKTLINKRQMFIALSFDKQTINYFLKNNSNITNKDNVVIYYKKINNVIIKQTNNSNNLNLQKGDILSKKEFKKIVNKHLNIKFIEYKKDEHSLFDIYKDIYEILISIVKFENLYIYKKDMVFINISKLVKIYETNYEVFAKSLQQTLKEIYNFDIKIGIGTNMVSALYAHDLYTNSNNNNICFFNQNIYQNFLKRQDLENIWSIGLENSILLNSAKVVTVENFVNLPPRSVLKILGTKGSEIQNNVKLLDKSNWNEKPNNLVFDLQNEILNHLKPKFKTVSKSQCFEPTNDQNLLQKYIYENILHCCKKLIDADILSRTVKIQIYYENFNNINFICQKTFSDHTNEPIEINTIALKIMQKHKGCKKQVKRVVVSLDNLIKNQGQKPKITFDLELFKFNETRLYLES